MDCPFPTHFSAEGPPHKPPPLPHATGRGLPGIDAAAGRRSEGEPVPPVSFGPLLPHFPFSLYLDYSRTDPIQGCGVPDLKLRSPGRGQAPAVGTECQPLTPPGEGKEFLPGRRVPDLHEISSAAAPRGKPLAVRAESE